MTTAQEIFDTVWKRAETRIRSTKPSSLADECVYRTDDGPGCFVGVLLTDDEYCPRMEGFEVKSLVMEGLLPTRLTAHLDLLCQLQSIHDDYPPEAWDRLLTEFAEHHELHVTPRDQLALPGVE